MAFPMIQKFVGPLRQIPASDLRMAFARDQIDQAVLLMLAKDVDAKLSFARPPVEICPANAGLS